MIRNELIKTLISENNETRDFNGITLECRERRGFDWWRLAVTHKLWQNHHKIFQESQNARKKNGEAPIPNEIMKNRKTENSCLRGRSIRSCQWRRRRGGTDLPS